ncbi:GH92 family glycosyl hydrolase [Kineosporia sp. J2-2]|uniref:GH92 family glycosyl hydrolase n=1 Tax=Kineosporia corallincola TaxID=2835133 RepID=A0ABS5TLR6_9ACTN|nr:GH92 family glycosyl hydrolase [Kineosporia corallincola]MBT0771955.1 GH92 family glycosyl hydrolase [Kineosporia corallincola]
MWSSGRQWLPAVVVAACLTALVPSPAQAAAAEISAFDAVNQFIGTEMDTTQNKSNDAYGNTYPGASVPFGMVQPSPTTWGDGNTNVSQKGGYEYTASLIRGFGMTRYSGTGCTGRYGGYEFPTIPYAGELTGGVLPSSPATNVKDYYLPFSHDDETSQPGYYGVKLGNGVEAELTASSRTAVSRYDFPKSGDSSLVLDVSGPNNRTFGSEVTIDPATRTVSGWMYGVDVCDNGNYYKAYFSTTYDHDFESYGTWTDDTMTAGSAHAVKSSQDVGVDYRHDTGAWLTFQQGAKVVAKTGFSYVSVENAALNRETEVGKDGFNDVRGDAKKLWKQALGTIDADGGTTAQRTKFYTALYHAFGNPNVREDVDGRYTGFDGEVHTVEKGHHFYRNINWAGSGWDAYRSQVQLIALTFPQVANDINRSVVALTEQKGTWAPGAARMQGDNYQVILATLDDMGATDYDRQAALDSMKATQVLPATKTSRTDGYQYFATGMIENAKGDFATSRVLEYSVDDFAIAQLARRMGDDGAYAFFSARSQSWMNVFDPETGHVMPRSRSGFDRTFDLRVRDDQAGRGQFNQSTGYQYGWMVPHNLSTLIEKRGGVAKATAELDTLMQQLDAGAYTQTGNYLSNQPAFGTPWVYNWLQAPSKGTDVLYRAVEEMYDTTPSGLPGNDDQGALSVWYVFANVGLYPAIPGTGDLVVSGPMFDRIVVEPVDGERVIRINAPGVSKGARYVAGMKVDGKARSKSYVDSAFVRSGGTLDFTMASTAGTWGTAATDVPPSYTEGADARNSVGTTPDGQGNLGSLDLSDWSLSRDALAAAGLTPGKAVPGTAFTWPSAEVGKPDNWIPHGQTVTVRPGGQGGSLSFLGLATNGPARGTAVVTYTDGSTQDVPFSLSDWAASPATGETAVVTLAGRNNADGTAGTGTFRVFASAPVDLDASKTVASVTLPEGTDKGIMHVFDVAVS